VDRVEARLLVDSKSFWQSLKKDIEEAREKIYIKVLSFEGDSAGKKVKDALLRSRAKEKRIIVDSYTRWALSDSILFVPHNLFKRNLWLERRETKRMFHEMELKGVCIKYTHPPSFLPWKLAMRDHKKLILIDGEITYLGGFNFSDHNFEWHDMMVRIRDKKVNEIFRKDFERSWKGENQTLDEQIGASRFIILNGFNNEEKLKPLFDLIDDARDSIEVINPYITSPYLDALLDASKRGVRVTIITPQFNNRGFLKSYLLHRVFQRDGRGNRFSLMLYPGMIHMKAICIDRKYLIFGSLNFDFTSFRIQPEYLVITWKRDLIEQFVKKVWERDLLLSKRTKPRGPNFSGWIVSGLVNLTDWYLRSKRGN
jgi:cardiolipin synthase